MDNGCNIGIIIATYNPDIDRLQKTLNSIAHQSSIKKLFIFDNHSNNYSHIYNLCHSINFNYFYELRRQDKNFGWGGCTLSEDDLDEINIIMHLDQDSILCNNYVYHLANSLIEYIYIHRCNSIVICGTHIYENSRIISKNSQAYDYVPMNLLSGSMMTKAIYQDWINARPQLHTDYIDTFLAYFISLRGGYSIKVNQLKISHLLGDDVIDISFLYRRLFIHKSLERMKRMGSDLKVFIKSYKVKIAIIILFVINQNVKQLMLALMYLFKTKSWRPLRNYFIFLFMLIFS